MKPKVGMKLKVKVTGIQSYGVFVDIMGEYRGLIHISECKEGYVANISDYFSVGDVVDAIIIDIDEYTGRISLSTRTKSVDLSVLNQHLHPNRQLQHYWTNYHINSGFSPLDANRESWLKEARKKFE
ncbi:CvfD/Ygs/GSP13 family RNA-binding post-transcriptional regulator [Lentilactobacillus sp. SPB1-3]|uniref:CvfD/Ygs/GSP13 family RNA-binding post-transcriptional regulator n=1 Tax=Lentilactobacillus terminaliae TaxID=3003483 RepID=A0ACD5DD27_9LACO|nr:CvfD/Ygs/GSP13 family RNA-binding post-transcriptional regulator [Lentilactobacillus sp. SPB1-3]MCZ0977900.1 CvfD/Ygs/GSP13 family RNA-binding post-transcriptional regulator [Lentilactobacillus sp. SPB1-3]